MAKKIRFVLVDPPVEGAIVWKAVHPDDAPHVFSTRAVFDEAVQALRGKHPGIPAWMKNDHDWREWVEDILDTHPRNRPPDWEERKNAALTADDAVEAWVNERYEKPELIQVGTVGNTDWPALPAQPWVKRS